MPNPEHWLRHSRMSDLGAYIDAVGALPADIRGLAGIVQGILVHEAWLGAYDLDERDYRNVARATLPAAERLSRVFERDSRPLQCRRRPDRREVTTCQDFALLLCAFFRSKQIPSRVRCGFAAYFGKPWEDHWVCEYWDRQGRQWRLCDPQLDDVLRERCVIGFDPIAVPCNAFMLAGQAWLACRDAKADPGDFGHGDVTGAWFVKINVVRDHYAVNNRETSAWDSWRAAPSSRRVVSERETVLLDDLAARPDQELIDITPDWREGA
ncbi:MAG TPA: transglutaminase domain-containing protein [Stellaceae bacterium]|nr:transglutaminase domain-containing protein [Stellaceae bacterium]